MKAHTRSIAILGALVILSACAADTQVQANPSPAAPATTTLPLAAEQVPNGRYSRVVTLVDAEGAGVDDETAAAMLGPDGEMPLTIELAGDRFTMHVTNEAAVSEVGDLGTVSYDEAGRLVLASEAVDVIQVFDWTLDGTELSLSLTDGAPEDRFVVNGTYTGES